MEDPDNPEHARPGLSELHARGQRLALPPHADPWPLPDLYRSLVPAHRDLLFATDQELLARLPKGVPKLLQLEAWHHPNVVDENERPSGNETFRQLAAVLVRRDPSLYRPTRPPNTHWSNWPDGGTL